jgi:2-polyprenyl-3-methyl-5-hydroxy-6-metoxy-1,4-benzoquinol methylase
LKPSHHHALHCPLCGNGGVKYYVEDITREYLRCIVCELVFVPEQYWLSAKEERATYDLHENDLHDQNYRKFLSRLMTPLLEKLKPDQKGLDFGCGPGPALAMMLEEGGHQVDLYDPFYYNDTSVFDKKYDFICTTEVVEHLRDPKRDFSALFKMLKPGGWLAIMTKLVTDKDAFRKWHYIRDLTHICFYGQRTFKFLAHQFAATIEFVADDVILLNRTC